MIGFFNHFKTCHAFSHKARIWLFVVDSHPGVMVQSRTIESEIASPFYEVVYHYNQQNDWVILESVKYRAHDPA